MPTYDYECTRCGQTFEIFQSITAKLLRKIKTDCAQCNNNAPVRRLIGTGAAVLFKGNGFYQTDYRSEAYKKAVKAEKDAASESKSGDKKSDEKPSKTTGGKSAKQATGEKPKAAEETKSD